MNTYEKLISVCTAVFYGEVDLSTVTAEDKHREDLGINSIGILYMALAIEEEFGIKFVNEDFAGIQTVQNVVELIEKKVS